MPEFHQRVGVLQQLGYVSPDGTVSLKGRAACEINSTQVGPSLMPCGKETLTSA
jgi:superfamily II RNA helicase